MKKQPYKIQDSFSNEYMPAIARIERLIELNGFFYHPIALAEKVTVNHQSIQLIARQYAKPKITISGLNDFPIQKMVKSLNQQLEKSVAVQNYTHYTQP